VRPADAVESRVRPFSARFCGVSCQYVMHFNELARALCYFPESGIAHYRES